MNDRADVERVYWEVQNARSVATKRDPCIQSETLNEIGYAVLLAAKKRWKNEGRQEGIADLAEVAARLLEEHDALDSVRRGLSQRGTIDRGSFAKYVDRSADGDVDVPPPADLREKKP